MWNERGGEGGGEAKIAPPSSGVKISDSESMLSKRISLCEVNYALRKGRWAWRDDNERRLASDYLEKDEFFKIRASDLDYFCRKFCRKKDPFWLTTMLTDALMLFKLHNTWQVYICPSCDFLRWFPDDDSLAMHLMYEHCNAWPFLPQDPTDEQWCSQALRSTVWKPIDIMAALNTLSDTMNSGLDTDHLASLEWPLSKDCYRIELLTQLQKGFEVLLDSRQGDSFTVRSGDCLRAFMIVASEHVLGQLDQICNVGNLTRCQILPPPFRALFYCSPLSFRFMDSLSLRRFTRLVKKMCSVTLSSCYREFDGSKDDDVNWRSKSVSLDAVSLSPGTDCFVLDVAKLDEKDTSMWLFNAPYFPTIKKLPTKASEIIQVVEKKAVWLSNCLRTFHRSNLKLPTTFLKQVQLQRAEFDCRHYLKLIKVTWELQFSELQVRRLCALDLRDYILPLLRSFFRMKLYMHIRIGTMSAPGDVKIEGNIMEGGSREEHPEKNFYSKVKGEPASGDVSSMIMPDMSSYKTSEELSTGAPELGISGSSANRVFDPDLMMMKGGEALEGEPHGASVGCTDFSASQVTNADAACFRIRTSVAAAIAESEAEHEAIPESDAEPEPQRSQAVQGHPLCYDFDYDSYSDSDSDSLSESEDFSGQTKEFTERKEFSEMKDLSIVVQLMREKCSWENKDNGLFVCVTINDVAKHCLEKFSLQTAQNIWGWVTNSTQKYWRCFECNKRFPDQESHMLHLESDHDLGISWDHERLVPSQVQQESQSGVNEGIEEMTDSLDDSITVDCTYRRFIVEMEKFGSLYQKEEEGDAQNINQFWQIVQQIRQKKIGQADAELKILRQNLSNLCVSDYKSEILPLICSFMLKFKDCDFRSWAQQRLDEYLGDVSDPYLGCCDSLFVPGSFSIKLVSSGKVIINMEENNAGITFAFVGIRLEFSGDVSFQESEKIKGMFLFSGILGSHDRTRCYASKVILDNKGIVLDNEGINVTMKICSIRNRLRMQLARNMRNKLEQFEAESWEKLLG